MKVALIVAMAAASQLMPALALEAPNTTPIPRQTSNTQVAVTCFFRYEQTSGMNKICYYDCLGSLAAITISSVRLCPLTINQ